MGRQLIVSGTSLLFVNRYSFRTMLDFPARGKILRIDGDYAVFNPVNTNYELHLLYPKGRPPAQLNQQIWVYIRATARKVWTVPSGGNFVTPIFGTPKIAQGRVKQVEERQMVLHAGVPIHVMLPKDDTAYDLINGAMAVSGLVNVTLMPGATIEMAPEPATV